jgi:glycosyltransferase involved in cell wall biosynthesis
MSADYEKGLVSVVVPNFNYARFLPACIESVIAQTYTQWELIVVDDNSTDNSVAIIQGYIDRYPDLDIKLLHNAKGPSGTPTPINIGIRAMRGEYFSWLSSDDICAGNKLEELVNVMKADASIGMTYSAFDIIDDDGNITCEECFNFNTVAKHELFLLLLEANRINGNTVLIRRDVFDQVGLFDEGWHDYQRVWMVTEILKWIEIILESKVFFVDKKLHYARIHKAKNPVYDSGLPNELMGMMVGRFIKQYSPLRLTELLRLSERRVVWVETKIARTLAKHGRVACLEERLSLIKQNNNDLYLKIREELKNAEHVIAVSKLAHLFILKGGGYEELFTYGFDISALEYLSGHQAYVLGSALKKASDYDRALQVFEHVTSRVFVGSKEIKGGAYFHLGEIYYSLGQCDKAKETFLCCLASCPDHTKAQEYMGHLLERQLV